MRLKEWSNESRLVYINGDYVPDAEARISIYDSALMFGDMVFEMTRSFNKKQFKLREHLERLYASIKYVRIPLKMTIDEMEQAVYDTIKVNERCFSEEDEHRIMINVTRGLIPIYERKVGIGSGPKVIISNFPLKWTVQTLGHLYDTGINVVIVNQRAIPAQLLEPKIKNRSRIHYQMANIEASQVAGEDNWALLLDPDGFVAEGPGDNFFIVKDGVVISPEGRNILRGISRSYIFELCDQLGIKWEEKNIEPYDVLMADEAFVTATPFCVLPVMRLNGQDIGHGGYGEITKLLLNKWSENVGVDIEQQIRYYSSLVDQDEVHSAYQLKYDK
jgi:branched-chain amino acid aminotransferase